MVYSNLPFNVSPKVAFTILSALVTWALAHYAIDLPDELEALIPLAIASVVGYQAPVGDVVQAEGVPSDEVLGPDATAHAEAGVAPDA